MLKTKGIATDCTFFRFSIVAYFPCCQLYSCSAKTASTFRQFPRQLAVFILGDNDRLCHLKSEFSSLSSTALQPVCASGHSVCKQSTGTLRWGWTSGLGTYLCQLVRGFSTQGSILQLEALCCKSLMILNLWSSKVAVKCHKYRISI